MTWSRYLFAKHNSGITQFLDSQALDLAVQATQACQFKDWWWKVQLGKCYYALGLTRDAEHQFRSALKDHKSIEAIIRLTRVYIRLDQPFGALDICKGGLEYFSNEVSSPETFSSKWFQI